MNFIEYHDTISSNISSLNLVSRYLIDEKSFSYEVDNLTTLRKAIISVAEFPFVSAEVEAITNTWLFESSGNKKKLTSTDYTALNGLLNRLRIKLEVIQEIAESSKIFGKDNSILIRIPEIQSFDSLSKYANDFKKSIELPILDKRIGGEANLLSADEGSIIFYVSVGTLSAIKLVGAICWAAGVIRRKRAEAKIFEEHAKTLELKNDALTSLIDAQKVQLKHVLASEAEAIATGYYDHSEPETIERLKLSISTISDLINSGVQIIPTSKNEGIMKSFPDYNKMDLIESTIKQIKSGD